MIMKFIGFYFVNVLYDNVEFSYYYQVLATITHLVSKRRRNMCSKPCNLEHEPCLDERHRRHELGHHKILSSAD